MSTETTDHRLVGGAIVPADLFSAADLVARAQELERLQYRSMWITDMFGREIYVTAAHLLAHTSTLTVATGIAHIYGRDAIASAQAGLTLSELSGGRFAQGLGVSHPIAAQMRGLTWQDPVEVSRSYLSAMRGPLPLNSRPAPPVPLYLAAHGPKMLAVAAEVADGVMSYMQTPDGIAAARTVLGPGKVINAVIPTCVTTDAGVARQAGRQALSMYLPLPAYQRVWRRAGFDEDDWAGTGSDRLVDTYLVWGDASTVRSRLLEYVQAGADEIIAGASPGAPGDRPPLEALADLRA